MLSSILAALFFSAIPVEWSVDTFRVKPFVYDCYHGETLDLAASMTAYGSPLDLAGKTAKLYWATNANATAWWVTNATVTTSTNSQLPTTNCLSATFSGAYDTGATETYGFIGVDGENYRAAFTLRFRPSPGFSPNGLNPPVTVLDFATVSVLNPESSPFVVKGGEGGVTLAQVTNVAQNVTSNIVPAWALSETPPESMTDNAVVLTNGALVTKAGDAVDYTTTNAVGAIIASSNLQARLSVVTPFTEWTLTNVHYATPVAVWTYESGAVHGTAYLWLKGQPGFYNGTWGFGVWGTVMTNGQEAASVNADSTFMFSTNEYAKSLPVRANSRFYDTSGREWFVSETVSDFAVRSGNDAVAVETTVDLTPTAASTNRLVTSAGAKSYADAAVSNALQSVDFTTNNTVLVSTITNVAGKAGGGTAQGIDLHDAGLGCDWQLSVSNSVFTWTVKED